MRRPVKRRSIQTVIVVVASVLSAWTSGAIAAECDLLALVPAPRTPSASRMLVFDHPVETEIDHAAPGSLSTQTFSRLVTLSGPFQSFQESRVAQDPKCGRWGGRDKVRHAAIFFATTLGLQLFIESTFDVSRTEAFLVSAAIGTLVGVGKELYDWRISDKDCFSEQDLLANTAGILSAGAVIMISN